VSKRVTRREFVRRSAAAAGLGLAELAGFERSAEAWWEERRADVRYPLGLESGTMPTRILGRTGARVSLLGFGTAPLGLYPVPAAEAEALVDEAIDLGIRYFDVAPAYNDAELKLGPVMRRRRDELFLVSKTQAHDREGVLTQIQESLRRLQTDHLDAVHLHNLGDFDVTHAFNSRDGAIAGLRAAKEAGYVRHFGISGHMLPAKLVQALDTGLIDLVMAPMNFVDRFTYDFEGELLPMAGQHGAAAVAMKVLGGANRSPTAPRLSALLAGPYYRAAIRYAVGLPGVSALLIGMKSREELHRAVATISAATPLAPEEAEALFAIGRTLAAQWGAHFGPVA
jgi:uncharacterized protein